MKIKKKKGIARYWFLLFLFLNAAVYSFIAVRIFSSNSQTLSGTLSPEAYKKEAQKIAVFCSLKQKEGCYATQFRELTKKTNLGFAKETLNELQNIDPANSRGCHLIAHYISIAETQKDPSKWKELLKQVDSNSCTGGYVHGILEAHTSADPNFRITAESIPLVCSYLPDAHAGGDLNCSHNLGHILLAQEDNNIPSAVKICNKLSGERVKYECLSGIFMERETRLNLQAHGIANPIPWDPEHTIEMEKICREYTGTAGLSCWREIAHMFATLNHDNPEGVFEACSRAPEPDYAKDCYMHASSIMVVSSNFDMKNLPKVCGVYQESDPLYDSCMGNMIGGMLMSSDKYSREVIQLCNSTSETYKENCYKKMGFSLSQVVRSPEKKEALCNQVPAQYKTVCNTSGIRLNG